MTPDTAPQLFDVLPVRTRDLTYLRELVIDLGAEELRTRRASLPEAVAHWAVMSRRIADKPPAASGDVILDGWARHEIAYSMTFLQAANLTNTANQGPQRVVKALSRVLGGYLDLASREHLSSSGHGEKGELIVGGARAVLREALDLDLPGPARGELELTHAVVVGSQSAAGPSTRSSAQGSADLPAGSRRAVRVAGAVAVALNELLGQLTVPSNLRPAEFALAELLPDALTLLGDYEALARGVRPPPSGSRSPSALLQRCSPFAVSEVSAGTYVFSTHALEGLQQAVRHLHDSGALSTLSAVALPEAVAVARSARALIAASWTSEPATTDATTARQALEGSHLSAVRRWYAANPGSAAPGYRR